MRRLPIARILPIVLATLAALFSHPAQAEIESGKRAAAAYRQCQGVDMLEELKAKDPGTYERILADADKVENAGAVLWRVEKKGVKPSHLLGTMHVSDQRIARLTPTAKAALDGSRVVLLEIADHSEKAMMAAMMRAADALVFKDGRRLDTLLEPEDYAKVKELVEKSGLPGELASVFRPWIVSTLLAVSECERKNTERGHPVLDSRIGQEARARKIKVVGLETVEGQLAAMASVPDDQQIAMLKAALKFAHRTDDMLETLTQMYLKRRMGAAMPFNLALAAAAGIGPDNFAGFQQELIDKRNRKMASGARPHIDKGGALVAVGALHLSGPTGLVKLLREAGYTVTPVE